MAGDEAGVVASRAGRRPLLIGLEAHFPHEEQRQERVLPGGARLCGQRKALRRLAGKRDLERAGGGGEIGKRRGHRQPGRAFGSARGPRTRDLAGGAGERDGEVGRVVRVRPGAELGREHWRQRGVEQAGFAQHRRDIGHQRRRVPPLGCGGTGEVGDRQCQRRGGVRAGQAAGGVAHFRLERRYQLRGEPARQQFRGPVALRRPQAVASRDHHRLVGLPEARVLDADQLELRVIRAVEHSEHRVRRRRDLASERRRR